MGKIFRVFFSSTLSDFVEERNALQKELCADSMIILIGSY